MASIKSINEAVQKWTAIISAETTLLEQAEKEESERRQNIDLWTGGRRAKRVASYKIHQQTMRGVLKKSSEH